MKHSGIAIYSRKSRFTGKGESIENQIELCKKYISVSFPDVDEKSISIYEDEGRTGAHLNRPQFQEMMKDARLKKFSVIVCYRLDRISRNIGDFAKLIEEFSDKGIAFVSIKEQFDTHSPLGRAMMYIASVFSQLERETTAERIRDNMYELSKTGRWLGGITPLGYGSEAVEKTTIDGKQRKSHKLNLVDGEGAMVRDLYAKFLATNSLTQTETYLLNGGYRTRKGKAFSRFAIKNILINPVYLIADNEAYEYLTMNDVNLFSTKEEFDAQSGIMAYNRTIQKTGKAHKIREMDEWIVSVGKHKGIISGADWIEVQKRLKQNRSKNYRKPRSHVSLLAGLVFCGDCGDRMRPKLSKRINADGEQIFSYLCSMKEKSLQQQCAIKNVNGNTLDKLICEEVKKLAEDESEFITQLEQSQKLIISNRSDYDKEIDRLKQLKIESEEGIKSLAKVLVKVVDTPTEQDILREMEELRNKAEIYRSRIEEFEGLTATHELSDMEYDLLRKLLSSFRDTFEEMSIDERRATLRTFIKKVVWDGENVHMYLFGSDDTEGGIELPDAKEPLCENSK